MALLNYTVLEQAGYQGYALKNAPEKVMQFGEGNFLRAFVDYFFDVANEKAGFNGKAVLVQPIAQGLTDLINAQEGLYTLYLRGCEKGRRVDKKRVISTVSRCIDPYRDWQSVLALARSRDLSIVVSNTTEAGIVYDGPCGMEDAPPRSFPAKLARVLHERYRAGLPGLTILSCELIDHNGDELKRCVNLYLDDWRAEDDFRRWVNEENLFCSTLVDRIVPGRIRDAAEAAALEKENGYQDALMDVGETFGFWAIEGPKELEARLPFQKAGLPVIVTPDIAPYKLRKVRILNGAHTGFVLGAYLAGFDIVRDCMQDETVLGFMNKMLFDEVIPTLPLDRQNLMNFAAAVRDRFNNPFVDHALLSISLNSTSKWRTRNMPSLLDYAEKEKKLPPCLAMSLAAYIAFYSSDAQALEETGLICRRAKGNVYPVSDDRWVLEFYWAHREDAPEELAHAVLANRDLWGRDLTALPGLEAVVAKDLRMIREQGAKAAFASCL